MPNPPVLGAIFYRDGIPPPSFFGAASQRNTLPKGKLQKQVVAAVAPGIDLYCMLRYPADIVLPVELSHVPVPEEAFQVFLRNPKILALFGVSLRSGHVWHVPHETMDAVLEDAYRLQTIAERVLPPPVFIAELFKDLAGNLFANAIVGGSTRVFLFYRSVGSIFRGSSGWFVELAGASRAELWAEESTLSMLKEMSRSELFGVPIERTLGVSAESLCACSCQRSRGANDECTRCTKRG